MLTPRVAAVHDMSGFGRCSLTVAIPILSAMGIQCCPLPTAFLSTHTGGFEGFTFLDMTDEMPRVAAHWKSLDLEFQAIYSGFLGSERQIAIVADFIRQFRRPDTLVVIDPVMGDFGKVYQTYTPGMSVVFLADNGEETLEFPAQEEESGAFTGEATCPLTDVIALSAVFIAGDTRQTQLLDQYENLYQNSFPSVGIRYLEFALMTLPQSLEGTVEIPESFGLVVEEIR